MANNSTFITPKRNWSRFVSLSGAFCICGIIASVLALSACSKNESSAINNGAMTNTVSHMGIDKPVPPAARLNPKNMFSHNLRSDSERLDRLERAVQDMRNQFDSVTPSIKRLMAVEGDIQNLLVELKKLSNDPSMAQPAYAPAPVASIPQTAIAPPQKITPPQQVSPAPRAPQPTQAKVASIKQYRKSPPPVQGGKATIYDIRVGEHTGKTRIVLDTNNKTDFKVDIDNSEKIMIIDLPSATWGAATSQSFRKSGFLSSYKVEKTDQGSMLILQLKKSAKIGYKSDLKGTSGTSRRIVIDLING